MATSRRERGRSPMDWPRAALSWWIVVAGIAYLRRRRPAQLLAVRYARGEIDGAEYRRSLVMLRNHHV
jgi:hypothetical protein